MVPGVLLPGPELFDFVPGLAALKALSPDETITPHLGIEALGEGIDHRDPDAVEPAGDGVGALFELAAGMEGAEHGGQSRLLGFRVIVDRDTPPVVDDPDAAVGQESDLGAGGETGHRLIDGVVDYLPNEVMETTRPGRSDVHAGPFAHGLEALEDRDVACVVGRVSDSAQSLLHGEIRGRILGPSHGIGAPYGTFQATDFMCVIIAEPVTDLAIPGRPRMGQKDQ